MFNDIAFCDSVASDGGTVSDKSHYYVSALAFRSPSIESLVIVLNVIAQFPILHRVRII